MSSLYSYKGAVPYPLPDNISEYQLGDFALAPPKPEVASDEKLGWDGKTWTVRKANESETVFQALAMRNERNRRLAECDWTQTLDAPVDQGAWSAYRQQLRDVTAQGGFPWAIEWPSMPA